MAVLKDFNTRAKGPRTVQKGPQTVHEDFSTRPKGPRRVQKGPKKTVSGMVSTSAWVLLLARALEVLPRAGDHSVLRTTAASTVPESTAAAPSSSFLCGCAEVFPRVRFASATAPSVSLVRIDNSTVVRPKISCLATSVPGQSRSQCSTVSLPSSHLGQEGLSAGFIRVLYPAKSMLCPERSLASMTASLLDRRVFCQLFKLQIVL